MNKKILCIIVCMLMLSISGNLISQSKELKTYDKSTNDRDYTHTMIAEYFTYTTCEPCKYAHQALKNIYKYHQKNLGYHPFYYISMVYDVNDWALERHDELGVQVSPTVAWDGPYRLDDGAESVQKAENMYNSSLVLTGNRNVKDIDLEIDVDWLGATNVEPSEGQTFVPVETNLTWMLTAMDIDVNIDNNENSQYNGNLRVYVTELNSTYWDDTNDYPYTFAFLDYAFNEDVSISAGGSWSDTDEWDGWDHNNGQGERYDEIYQDNCMVIAAIFDEDNSDYADETDGFLAGENTGPKIFDIYFGNTTPPPLLEHNTSIRVYDPTPGADEWLEFDTTYYWKITVWNNKGEKTAGDIFNFTTRGNSPPNLPYNERPRNKTSNNPIDTNLTWVCADPDMDDMTYDVYFGLNDPMNPPEQVGFNISLTTFDPSPLNNNLEFDREYKWYIVAWDQYGCKTVGDTWFFTTEKNKPPNQASDPIPDDGASSIPIDLEYLYWNGSDPNSGDKLTYDVYFDDVFPPGIKSTGQKEESYKLKYILTIYKTYYWRIDTYDRDGLKTEGENWSFTTGENHPPVVVISGPSQGVPNKNYEFKFTVTDPDGHDVRLYVDWDDGTNSGWLGPYDSGATINLTHSWSVKKLYTIEAKAKDQFNKEGALTLHDILIPRSKSLIVRFLQRYFYSFPIIRQLLGL